jgi:hypothetical protein
MKYVSKPRYVEAIEWNEPGDHPEVGYFRYPPVDPVSGAITGGGEGSILMGEMRHCDVPWKFHSSDCTRIMHDHGYIDAPNGNGVVVCPGDMLSVFANGRTRGVWRRKTFDALYDKIEE